LFFSRGKYIPPFIINPRQRMEDGLLDGAPSGRAEPYHPSGWKQSDLLYSVDEPFCPM
jgi:hypothetical protein